MEFEVAISFFIGGKNMRHIGEKIILVLCIAVFGIAAMNLVEIGKEYYVQSICLRATATITPAQMLMYGKEASNRKQEIDRQHYTIPNQRPKDKHCGKI